MLSAIASPQSKDTFECIALNSAGYLLEFAGPQEDARCGPGSLEVWLREVRPLSHNSFATSAARAWLGARMITAFRDCLVCNCDRAKPPALPALPKILLPIAMTGELPAARTGFLIY